MTEETGFLQTDTFDAAPAPPGPRRKVLFYIAYFTVIGLVLTALGYALYLALSIAPSV